MKVLEERRADIAQATRSLSDAIGRMSLIRDAVNAKLETVRPGDPLERVALKINLVVNHLVDAGGDLPNEFWGVLLNESHVGGEEVRARLLGDNAQREFKAAMSLGVPA